MPIRYLPLILLLAARVVAAASSPDLIRQAAEHGEGLWKQIATREPRPETGCRGIIGYALALCEARMHPERLKRLFVLVRSMQDVDPKSKNRGNLKWYWRDPGVTDANAIEFCMQDALTISARHGDWLPADAREELLAFIRQGVQGCMLHRVPTDYTNIAILNSGNLIVAGERFDRPDSAVEGRSRLDGILLYTAAFGIHEYDSPTYYGTDLSGLLMLHTLGREPRERDQAEAMLKLMWTDIAANWLAGDEKLGGCHSRSYDYVRGVGGLDWHLWAQGWLRQDALPSGKPPSAERREPWGDQWSPPSDIIALRDGRLPRFVEQRWGPQTSDLRWHWIAKDVSLSCAGACYGTQDAPLTIDLPGKRDDSRCYFIADGRDDPYGKKKYATGSANHMKALHLQPFWAGAKNDSDAVGLALYLPNQLREPNLTRLQSHFILRRPTDGIWLDGKRVEEDARDDGHGGTTKEMKEKTLDVKECRPLVLRYGSAAVALCVPWTIHAKGRLQAKVSLIDDGNKFDCLRLTVDHGPIDRSLAVSPSKAAAAPVAGAAFWVRVGSGLNSDLTFEKWRKKTEAESPESDPLVRSFSNFSTTRQDASADDGGNESASRATFPWTTSGAPDCVIQVNGREIGRPLLEAVEPLRSMSRGAGFWQPINVQAAGSTTWQASDGLILPGMKVAGDAEVKRFVVQEPSDSGQPAGSAFYTLQIERAGTYYLWARAKSKDNKHGSFVYTISGRRDLMNVGTWDLHSPGRWRWLPLPDSDGHPQAFSLPAGKILLQLRTKSSGAAIDKMCLSTHAEPPEKM